jgi:phage terminase large subunit
MSREQSTSYDQRVELLPKQDDFIFSSAKYPAFISGLGAGKTYAGCLKAVLKMELGQDGVILAPTYPMLRDVTQKTFLDILDGSNLQYEFYKTDGVLLRKNARVLFRSADAPDRLRGPNLNWAYLDEAAQMYESMWNIILGRLRVGRNPGAWITTTPAGYNWVYRRWVEKGDPAYHLIHASTRENTFLPQEYIDDLESNYVGEFAKQEIDGDFVAFEGLVYPDFSRSLHIYKPFPIPDSWPRYRALDYGYTNPFVCLWGALDEDKRLYIYTEHYQPKTLLRDHVNMIKARNGNVQWTVADWDAQDNAEMAALGVPTNRARKEVLTGIRKVMARLVKQDDGKPRLFISEDCKNLIREFGLYRWNETKEGRNDKEEPVKENDHAMDALRYLIMELDCGGFILV